MTEIRDRRRTSFNAVAQAYDKARPEYPAELIEAIISFAALPQDGRILEIGSGTGKATLPFAQRGYRMLCVELGENMAAVAREKLAQYPVEIVVGNFDAMEIEEDAFDLAISAQAFHWLDPAIALPKIARALHQGGSIALFWNVEVGIEGETAEGPADFTAAAHELYKQYAPVLTETRASKSGQVDFLGMSGAKIADYEQFGAMTMAQVPWEVVHSAAEYIELLGTHSDHLTLEPEARARLLDKLTQLINTRFGGRITRKHVAAAFMAKRV